MTPQEVESWTREIVSAVLLGQPVEDSRVELKNCWIDYDKAASRLAGHANASRGNPILWIVGVDEKNKLLSDVDPKERENWYFSVQKRFDGLAPRLAVDVNVRINDSTVVALYFETHQESPYVVKHGQGGYPDLVIPWREGTRIRSARRDELLRLLIPNRQLASIIAELELNALMVEDVNMDSLGSLFRTEEVDKALSDGGLAKLPDHTRKLLNEAFIAMRRANHHLMGAMSVAAFDGVSKKNEALRAVQDAAPKIVNAYKAMQAWLRS
ncbi:MAG: hypothetical protein U0Z53_15185 [Blastocatellia bacterium]